MYQLNLGAGLGSVGGWGEEVKNLLVLLHKVSVEYTELLHHQFQFVRLGQNCATEVEGTR